MSEPIEQLRKIRIQKLGRIKKTGINPYPSKFIGERISVEGARSKKLDVNVSIAGRIRAWRTHGKLTFADLQDESGKIQICFKQDVLGKEKYEFLQNFDIGDFLGVSGTLFKTKAAELTVLVSSYRLLTKSIRPLPAKWHGLKDVEERYRQRYVDLLMNEDVRKIFYFRTKIIDELRSHLNKNGFLEVETPVLQPIYGGATARPFVTFHKALDYNLYLRISDELYLKRLIVGGFEKVYEFAKDFRNEGVDRQHNPEFTQLEFYWAYADYEQLMEFTEEMLSSVIEKTVGKLKIKHEDVLLDFTPPWQRVSFHQALLKTTGIDIEKTNTEEQLLLEIKKRKIKLDLSGMVGYGAILDEFYKKTLRPKLVQPTLLLDYPVEMRALAKRKEKDPKKVATFQLVVKGFELITAYNELNDPLDQTERWREQKRLAKKGLEEYQVYDTDYIRALEYGMPPTAGWGLGIDRFVSFLTDSHSIKEVILFPTLRPER